MEFTELNLNPDLARGIAEAGYKTCMPVQEQVLSCAFGGQDLYVQSQTGTGKTAAFLIVIFQRLLTEPLLNGKKALIMAPTRELAVQIEEEAKLLASYLPFKIGSFYGGVGYNEQLRLLRDNVQILVGTPGRVLDLNASGQMNLMDLAFLVLDEADRMFDMGFYPDLRKLIRVVPPADRRQTMLFSATLNNYVKNLAWEYTKEPREIEIESEHVTVDEIDQFLYHVPSEDKFKLLLGILEREKPESLLIFCNTKRYAEIVAKRLRINGYECEFIMGDLPQQKRLRVIEDLKAGKVNILVATDVAARGLDIEALAMVVNYDLPNEAENYVHRIGRTARAGKTGRAITLASEQDVYELVPIERYIGAKIPSEIAREELYGEDKSEGMRIQTDYYEGGGSGPRDRSGRGGHDRDRSSSGRRPSREGRTSGSEGRRERSGRGANTAGSSLSGEENPVSGEGRRASSPGRSPSGEGRTGRSPSSAGRSASSVGRTASNTGRRRPDSRPASGAGPAETKRRGDRRPVGGDREGSPERASLSKMSLEERMNYYKEKYDSPRKGRDRPRKDREEGAPQNQGQSQEAAGKGEAKKGILGKILGFFRK